MERPALDDLRKALRLRPGMIRASLELARADSADELEQYFVDVDFTVNRQGRVLNVSLLDSNAPRKLQRYVTNTLRYSRYRPIIQDGEAVKADNIKLRQTFTSSRAGLRSANPFNRVSTDTKRTVSLGCQILALNS